MADAGSPSSAAAEIRDLSEEDKQTVLSLYQTCPRFWADFRLIVDFLDALDTQSPVPFGLLSECVAKLSTTFFHFYPHDDSIKELGQFAAVIGFVDRGVELYRQAPREHRQLNVTDRNVWYHLRSLFLNFSLVSVDFCRRLFQTGFLQDILRDLQHIQHMPADAAETRNLFLNCAGAIHNWCRHDEVLLLVKQNRVDVVNALVPFREKTSGNQIFPAIALMVISFVGEDDQLNLFRLHTNTLQYLLDIVKAGLDSRESAYDNWRIDAILCGILRMVRCEFNRRLLTAQGTTKLLRRVLATPDRSNVEKQAAVDILNQLAQDPHNLRVLRNDRELTETLRAVSTTCSEGISDSARNLLSVIQRMHGPDSEDCSASASLDDLLADELNVLSILGMGEVEYVMDRLTRFTAEGGSSNSTSDVNRLKILQALTELTSKDDGCRREIMARGALNELTKVLQTGEEDEKEQALRILLELAFCEETQEIMKNRPDFVMSLSLAAVAGDNEDLSQAATIIVQALNQ